MVDEGLWKRQSRAHCAAEGKTTEALDVRPLTAHVPEDRWSEIVWFDDED
jgi:hypothetical protein